VNRPDWLEEARAHLREHYPHDGVSLSVLYELLGAGFEMAVTCGGES